MSSSTMTIFIAPPEIAKVTQRYICLLHGKDHSTNRYIAENSLVELAKALNDDAIDWPYVEEALLQKGVYST